MMSSFALVCTARACNAAIVWNTAIVRGGG